MLLYCIVIIASTKRNINTRNLIWINFLVPLFIENKKLWSVLNISYYYITLDVFKGKVIKCINTVLRQQIHNIDNIWFLNILQKIVTLSLYTALSDHRNLHNSNLKLHDNEIWYSLWIRYIEDLYGQLFYLIK